MLNAHVGSRPRSRARQSVVGTRGAPDNAHLRHVTYVAFAKRARRQGRFAQSPHTWHMSRHFAEDRSLLEEKAPETSAQSSARPFLSASSTADAVHISAISRQNGGRPRHQRRKLDFWKLHSPVPGAKRPFCPPGQDRLRRALSAPTRPTPAGPARSPRLKLSMLRVIPPCCRSSGIHPCTEHSPRQPSIYPGAERGAGASTCAAPARGLLTAPVVSAHNPGTGRGRAARAGHHRVAGYEGSGEASPRQARKACP